MTPILDGKEYLNLMEAAEGLKTTVTKVLMLLRDGQLQGKEMDGTWLIEPESVACARTHGIDQKTAKGCASYCSSAGCGCK